MAKQDIYRLIILATCCSDVLQLWLNASVYYSSNWVITTDPSLTYPVYSEMFIMKDLTNFIQISFFKRYM